MRSVDVPSRTGSCSRTAGALLVVLATGAGCAASKDAAPETPAAAAAHEPTVSQPGQYAGQADAGTAAQPPSPMGSPFDELDRAERELTNAIDDKPNVADGLSTGDRCTTVCRALASMRRSADQICNLDASRCTDARARLTKAEERAKGACPACSSTPT